MKYLKSIFQVHFGAGACIGEYKGCAPLYLWNFTIKRFTRRCWRGLPNRPQWMAAGLDSPGESRMRANEDPCRTHYARRPAPPDAVALAQIFTVCEGDDAAVIIFARFIQRRTGRSISTMIAHFLRFRNGRIVELREFMDSFHTVKQLLGRELDLEDR